MAVRVRPFNGREKGMKAKCCIRMKTPMTWIKNPENNQEKPFTFDYSYWSHDGYKDEDGLLIKTNDNYATQMDVYQDVGETVLNNCFEGYNCSLFAYGQTGSGKSYSMVGYGKNKGIIPIVCDNLFKRIDDTKGDATVEYRVTVTMLEIYNEQLRDLLHPKATPKGGLKIRRKKGVGVYIPGLKDEPVATYKQIDKKMQEGTMNRTVASTKMNATSSRAHTIFGIMFTKIVTDGELRSETVSKINLVDLAGSERAESTGATGDRLKEGCAINQSLSSLGNVISALADQAMGKKKVFVPYRNSVLTQMLQDALGGNSKTIMICALSPADVNYDETLSTLRYADRAKKIKNKIVKNENPTDKAIRLLKEENKKLKALLEGKGVDINAAAAAGAGGGGDPAEMKALQDKLKEMEENQKMIDEMKKSWEDKIKEAKERASVDSGGPSLASDASELKCPYLINLHEDSSMTETFLHKLKEGKVRFGRKDAETAQDVTLSGLGIKKEHCIFENDGAVVSLSPLNQGKTFVNGVLIKESTKLTMGDRVIIGSNFFFRFQTSGDHKEEKLQSFKEAMDELMSNQSNNMSDAVNSQMSKLFGADEKAEAKNAELEKKLAEMERKMKAAEAEAEKRLLALQSRMSSGEVSAEDIKKAAASESKELNAEKKVVEAERKKVQREKKILISRKRLEGALDKLIPRIKEVNQVAQEMTKPLTFELKLQQRSDCIEAVTATDQADRLSAMEPVVRVKNTSSGAVWLWSREKFDQRRYLIMEMFQEFQEGQLEARSNENDPFWDPPQATKIGRAFVYLKALSHLVEIEGDFHIVDFKGQDCGKIAVKILPMGLEDEELDYLTEGPQELLGMDFKLQVVIESATGIPEKYANHLHVNFLFNDKSFQTPMVEGKTTSPKFSYKQDLKFESADDALLQYLLEKVAVFEICGFSDYFTPNAELACNHCDENRAVLNCLDCKKQFCQKCFQVTHKNPKKRGHKTIPMGDAPAAINAPAAVPAAATAATTVAAAEEKSKTGGEEVKSLEPLCSSCEEAKAELKCLDCDNALFCKRCWGVMHKKPSKKSHRTEPLASAAAAGATKALCETCEEEPASFKCVECDSTYCERCFGVRHKAPSKKNHQKIAL